MSSPLSMGYDRFTRFVFWAGVLLIERVGAQCPNGCSGHGECLSLDFVCTCDAEWDIEPDCSTRKCPKAPAWTSRAYDTNLAHSPMECGNRGTCDRSTGICECDEGFTGQACERIPCANDCSDHGVCLTIYRAGIDLGADTPPGYLPGGDGRGPAYENWDAMALLGCECDWGHTSSDCSLRLCPRGDDPMTTGQVYRKINITTNGTLPTSQLNGTFEITFQGHSFEFNANASLVPASTMEYLWESLGNVYDVKVEMQEVGRDFGTTYSVEFISWPSSPALNNYFSHEGNPPLSSFTCDISGATATTGNATCLIRDVVATNVKEYIECSGRGTCSHASGSCTCYSGFEGIRCDSYAPVLETNNDGDILLLHSKLSTFEGNLLHLKSSRSANAAFNMLYAESNSASTLTVAGDGDVTMHKGGLTISQGGQTITAGGLTVTSGGQTINGGIYSQAGGVTVTGSGLMLSNVSGTIEHGGLTVKNGSVTVQSHTNGSLMLLRAHKDAYEGTVLKVQSDRLASNGYKLFEAVYDGDGSATTIFSISGKPSTNVETGGLNVVGGATIASGGLNVSAGGLFVAGGGGTINGNLFVAGSVSYTGTSTQASDARFKQSVENVSSNVALETILKLRPVTYQWNDQAPESRDQTRQLGFIAQDLLAALPRSLVNVVRQFDSEGHLGVSYDRIPVLLAGALQELDARHQKQISNLSSELERLKHLVTKLQDELQALREQPNLSLERMA